MHTYAVMKGLTEADRELPHLKMENQASMVQYMYRHTYRRSSERSTWLQTVAMFEIQANPPHGMQSLKEMKHLSTAGGHLLVACP